MNINIILFVLFICMFYIVLIMGLPEWRIKLNILPPLFLTCVRSTVIVTAHNFLDRTRILVFSKCCLVLTLALVLLAKTETCAVSPSGPTIK